MLNRRVEPSSAAHPQDVVPGLHIGRRHVAGAGTRLGPRSFRGGGAPGSATVCSRMPCSGVQERWHGRCNRAVGGGWSWQLYLEAVHGRGETVDECTLAICGAVQRSPRCSPWPRRPRAGRLLANGRTFGRLRLRYKCATHGVGVGQRSPPLVTGGGRPRYRICMAPRTDRCKGGNCA